MAITVELGKGMKLSLELEEARGLLERLRDAVGAAGDAPLADDRRLDDDHPVWGRNTKITDGYEDPEWGPGDEQRAEAFYGSLRGKAKVFLDLLIDRPGRQLTTEDVIEAGDGEFKNAYSVAGAINGLRLPRRDAGRRYPFYWWEGSPTKYAMKPGVASLFDDARRKVSA